MKMKLRNTLVAVFLLPLSIIGTTVAHAHTTLISSDPKAESVVRNLPEKVTLTFDQPLMTFGNKNPNIVVVKDPMGMLVTTKVSMVNGAILTNVLNPPMLAKGIYSVTFRVVSQDGHPVQGGFTFTLDPQAQPSSSNSKVTIPQSGLFTLTAHLDGNSVDGMASGSKGAAEAQMQLDFSKKVFCVRIISTNLPNPTAIHIHPSSLNHITDEDEIILPVPLSAINSKNFECHGQDMKSMAYLLENPDHYMMMVHTKEFPDGAISGNLKGDTNIKSTGDNHLSVLDYLVAILVVTALALCFVFARRNNRKQLS